MAANDFVDKISSLDAGYSTGSLSVYPSAIDSTRELFEVSNAAQTVLSQTLGYASRFITVDSTDGFVSQGLIKIGEEIVYYSSIQGNQFRGLKRGFAGSRQGQWPMGTSVVGGVMAETHNANKDAILNIEANLGITENPAPTSLNGILKDLENRFLAPKPIFQAYPLSGPPPLQVSFQNFSTGESVRYLWDFGDGSTSTESTPIHTYVAEGIYSVKLNLITTAGAQGVSVKSSYIKVDSAIGPEFFYVTPMVGTTATVFSFVDQTVGNVSNRYWVFDDGGQQQINDPDQNVTSYTYSQPGVYTPSLIVVFVSGRIIRLLLSDPIVVT